MLKVEDGIKYSEAPSKKSRGETCAKMIHLNCEESFIQFLFVSMREFTLFIMLDHWERQKKIGQVEIPFFVCVFFYFKSYTSSIADKAMK